MNCLRVARALPAIGAHAISCGVYVHAARRRHDQPEPVIAGEKLRADFMHLVLECAGFAK
jgi:hypothetical protein